MNGDFIMNKNEKRKEIKQKQSILSPEYCHFADKAICNRILSLHEFQTADVIFCYISMENEIDTRPIIENAWMMKKKVAVPKCTKKGCMELYQIHSYEDLEAGKYGIPEPKSKCLPVPPNTIDFAVIPCLSCDLEGWRLGHGGGYYDRYLEHTDFITAVVCRHQLLSECICHETHDNRMNIVVTEEIMRFL